MDLKRLKTFITVAEHGTVSKASQMLNITQPALSRQLSALELELGFKLFSRSGRRLELTARGEQLLGDSRSLLSQATTLNERAQALRRGDIKVLKVAGSPLTIEASLTRFVRYYAERVPDIRLSFIEANAAEHLSMLERGEVHFTIDVINDVQVDDDRFGSHVLQKFHILAAFLPSMKIERSHTIEIRQLCQQTLLLLDTTYATRSLFDAACRLAGTRPTIFIESNSAHTLLALAEEGHGVAVVPSVVRIDRSGLRTMTVTHRREPLEITVAALWDKRRTMPQYAKTFSQLLAAHMQERFPLKNPTKRAASGR